MENNKKIPVVAVVGPTASGKTGLGIALAKELDGEIVSADSMQIYKGFPIASAVPTEKEKSQATHHLIEFLDPKEKFSVADYVKKANEVIFDIHSRGKLPIIVGGTGLYISSLINGITFNEQKPDEDIRKALEEEYELLGGDMMLSRLKEIDEKTANRLSPNDKKRILRAFELYETTGLTISEQNELSKKQDSPYSAVMIGITYENREKLYERINMRVDIMLQNGLLDEAKNFFNTGVTASQAIGHKELIPYLSGQATLEDCVEQLKRETRRYAKRQLTWFRRDERINWIFADKENVYDRAIEIISEGMK